MIHVCYCFRDKTGRYSKFAGTSMLSLFENTSSEVTIHILHDETLTDDNRDKFNQLAGQCNRLVKFYNVAELCPDKIKKINELLPDADSSTVTVGSFYKLLIPQVLPPEIKKVIFLDPDTVVNLDLSELWQFEPGDTVLGVVTEKSNGANPTKAFLLCSEGVVKPEDYFNGGVLLMNLELLRGEEDSIMKGIEFRGNNPKQKYFEQTVLNYCFSTRTIKLPVKFNRFVRAERGKQNPDEKIYHYASGNSRPGLEFADSFNRLWLNYFIRTPFFDSEVFGRLLADLQKIRRDLKDVPFKLSAIMPGKMRAFFIEPKKIDEMKRFFTIKAYEEIIPAENETSLQKLIEAMRLSQGMCVFFILTEKFLKKKFPADLLKAEGFKEDKDFVQAWKFLSEEQGVPFDSFQILLKM